MNQSSTKNWSTASKDVLARLLATENLFIVHSPTARTASFDTKTRVLTIPSWSADLGEAVVDLFDAHEVGHALFTPTTDPTELAAKIEPRKQWQPTAFSYLNICEDVRIERMVKDRYPGLKPVFAKAYASLHNDKNFFRLKSNRITAKQFGLIDRINLHFKVGAHLDIDFTDAERVYVTRLTKADTFEQVFQIAKELYDLSKQASKTDNQEQNASQDDDSDTGEGDAGESMPSNDDSNEDSDGNDEPSRGAASDEESDEDSNSSTGSDQDDSTADEPDGESPDGAGNTDSESTDEEESAPGANKDAGSDGQTKSNFGDEEQAPRAPMTQDAFDQSQQGATEALNAGTEANPNQVGDFYLPKYGNKHLVISYQNFRDASLASLTRTNSRSDPMKLGTKALEAARIRAQDLITEFNRRKAARTTSNTKVSRTGRLNMSKLSEYRYNDNLFLTKEIVNNAKSHGFTFLIDNSGSMYGSRPTTMAMVIDQAIVMMKFARAVGIPFKVYAFTDASTNISAATGQTFDHYNTEYTSWQHPHSNTPQGIPGASYNVPEVGRYRSISCHLLTIADSSMAKTNQQFTQMVGLMKALAAQKDLPWSAGGTPALESYAIFMEETYAFAKQNASTIQNIVAYYLADGDGSAMCSARESWDADRSRIIDPVTRVTYANPDWFRAIVNGTNSFTQGFQFFNRVLRDRLRLTLNGMNFTSVGIIVSNSVYSQISYAKNYLTKDEYKELLTVNKLIDGNFYNQQPVVPIMTQKSTKAFDLFISMNKSQVRDLEYVDIQAQPAATTQEAVADAFRSQNQNRNIQRSLARNLAETIKGR